MSLNSFKKKTDFFGLWRWEVTLNYSLGDLKPGGIKSTIVDYQITFIGTLQSWAQGHFGSLSAVWLPNYELWENGSIQFFWLVDRKTIASTQGVRCTEGIDRAGNRTLIMINSNCFYGSYCCFFCVWKFSLINCLSMHEKK